MLILAGVNHKSSTIEVRERLAALGLSAARKRLAASGFQEAVILGTCNRFEVYAAAPFGNGRTSPSGDGASQSAAAPAGEPVHPALGRLTALFDDFSGLPASASAYRSWGANAAYHLFTVASGLDSLIVGETEILGQVKGAYEAARDAGATGKLTNILFQRALFVGKLVRERTRIALGQTSAASVAVELAQRIFGRLRGREVLILGAGRMAEKAARHLVEAKVRRIHIANRTWEKSQALACALSTSSEAFPVRWEDFPGLLAQVDVVIASTGSPAPVLDRAAVEKAGLKRQGRPLFLIDIAMPRDVSEDVAGLDEVYLYSLADLESLVAGNIAKRRGEMEAAREIVRLEAQGFSAWLDGTLRGERATLRRALLPERSLHP
ncbi:MAG: glutamyl-tRNA reductase [Elusimicrobia bacterium]|nr:glutamyl-tRNA reductase [Elusimicrobiota bacterium]